MQPTLKNMNYLNIVSMRQNNPELVVQDCIKEFNLTESQANKLRLILIARGVNKWLFARRNFIKLKHIIKTRLKESKIKSNEYYIYSWLNKEMQSIAKCSRWVEWPKTTTHNFRNIERDIKVLGKKM